MDAEKANLDLGAPLGLKMIYKDEPSGAELLREKAPDLKMPFIMEKIGNRINFREIPWEQGQMKVFLERVSMQEEDIEDALREEVKELK